MQSWGRPLTTTSAYRDPAYNESVGGARGSQHIHGNAFDVSTAGMSPEERASLIQQAQAAGFQGFGGYDGSLHFDVGPSRMWGSDYTNATTPDWLRDALGIASPIQISTSGVNAMPMNPQQPQGLLGFLGIQKQDPTATDQTALPFYQRDRFKDTMGNVAMALNELRLTPSQAVPAIIQKRQDRRATEGRANASIDWLRGQSGGEPYAQAILAGGDPAQALTSYAAIQRSASEAGTSVQSSQLLHDGTSVVMMRDGTRKVFGPAGNELTGEEAAKAISDANQAAIDYSRDVYGARREGTNIAEAETGAEAAAASEIGKQSVRLGEEYFTKANALVREIGGYDRALAALDQGAESGVIKNMLPNVSAEAGELKSAMNDLGLAVVAGTTFGALSASELELALETAVPIDLSTGELRQWLIDRKAYQQKAYAELIRAAAFFSGGGTLAEWIKQNGGQAASGSTGATPAQTETQTEDDGFTVINPRS